jgi:hypothetical protein
VFTFPNVFHFFAHKLASLSAGGLTFPRVFARAFNCFFFRHNKMVSPLETPLDVNKKRRELLPAACLFPQNHSYRPPS